MNCIYLRVKIKGVATGAYHELKEKTFMCILRTHRTIVYINEFFQAFQTDKPQLRTAYAWLLVKVDDRNVNKPEMIPDTYSATIPENSPRENYVLQVTAQDKDTVRETYFCSENN